MSLSSRKQYAKRCFLNGRTNSRGCDRCFEMGDGGEVVKYLMNQAQTNPKLKEAILKSGTWDYWQYFVTHGSYDGWKY